MTLPKYTALEKARDTQRQAEYDVRAKAYYDEVDRKRKRAFEKHRFENYIIEVPIEWAIWFFNGSLWYFFGCPKSKTNKMYVGEGDLIQIGEPFFGEYRIDLRSPISGLVTQNPYRQLQIRPIIGQDLPTDLGLFVFGDLIEYIENLERTNPDWNSGLSNKYPKEDIRKGVE
ncbi:MAG: hypothetical protein KF734_01750 [Saprospiraceae bacterium]|nr:hypothetical protein [Saprospiraceae bacterium]